ncbi:MAG: ketopantoate reductase family protein [Dehalococcoidia bacterium]|nr:ketopantoate reductase family protein [Dehalococcoidia bacterium]
MRFVVYGAGGVGGTIGGRRALAGHDVVLICRGAHLAAIRERGLFLRTPAFERTIPVEAVAHPGDVHWTGHEHVLLTMKTQDTESALRDLELAAGTAMPVFCVQNGVENERLALRRFERVYATLVALPATFVTPGEVIASAAPLSGCLHSGSYPGSVDATVTAVCAAFAGAGFHALPSEDVMALKYRKLVLNLGNGIEIITGESGWAAQGAQGEFVDAARREALAVYAAAGIRSTSPAEYVERVTAFYKAAPVGGVARSGSSTLQSVQRGHQTTEVDYLNGEIEMLGRLYGVPTPYNTVIRRVATRMAAGGEQPGSTSIEALNQMVAAIPTDRPA